MKGFIINDLALFLQKTFLSNLFSAGQDLQNMIKITIFKQFTRNKL